MSQEFNIVGNLLLKVDGAEAGLNKLKNSLSKLEMPKGLENSFKKSFSNLDGLFEKYKAQLKDGFNTKGDVSAFAKTGKQIEAEYDKISAAVTKLTGKEISLKVNLSAIQNAEKELEKLIAQRDKLTKDIKGGLGLTKMFEAIQASDVGRRGTKVFDASNILQTSLGRGDLEKARADVEALISELNRMSEVRKQALEARTETSLSNIIDALRNSIINADNSLDELNGDIKTTSDSMANMRADQMEKVGKAIEDAVGDADRLTSGFKQINGGAQEAAQSMYSMTHQLEQLKTSTQYFFSLSNMINLFKRGVREAVQTVKDLDAAMTETAVVTDFSVGDMWEKLPEYTAQANSLGATIQDMYESTTLYYQQGLNTQQAMGIATETMKMARIAGLEAADATDMMTAALRGFNMEINEASAQHINDVYSQLAAKTASDTEELGTAMQRTASIAHSAGMSFEGTTAFLAQAIETTREPAENLGTAMKTIIARFQELKKNPLEMTEVDGEVVDYNKVDAALKTIGVDLKDTNGQFRALDEVFLDISQRWDGLSQTQQRYIATTAAGSRQQSRFIAMMSDYNRTMELMGYANDSAGASQAQFNKTLDSLEAKLNKFKTAWQRFLMGIMNDSWTKGIVDGATTVLSTVNELIDKLSFGSKGIKSFLSIFTAFTGLKTAGRLANMAIGGLGGILDPKSSIFKGMFSGVSGMKQGANAAQAKAISDPIVTVLKQIYAKMNDNKVTAEGLARGTWKDFKDAQSKFQTNAKTGTIGDTIGTLNGLDKAQINGVLANNPAIESRLQRGFNQYIANMDLTEGTKKATSKAIPGIFKAFKQDPNMSPDAFVKALRPDQIGISLIRAGQGEAGKELVRQFAQQRKEAYMRFVGIDPKDEFANIDLKGHVQQGHIKEYQDFIKNYKGAEGGALPEPSKWDNVASKVGAVGAMFGTAGQAVTSFGMALSGLGLEKVGNGIANLGTHLSSLGATVSSVAMTISSISNVEGGFGAIWKSIKVAGPYILAIGAALAAVGLIVHQAAKETKAIKDSAEEVTKTFEETSEKTKENISNLKQYKDEMARLSKGVDQNGNNINLSNDEYDEYLKIVDEVAAMNPEIVRGYNAQGHAIIDNNTALQKTLDLQEQINKETTDQYLQQTSLEKLLAARNLRDSDYTKNTTFIGEKMSRSELGRTQFMYGDSNYGIHKSDIKKQIIPLQKQAVKVAKELQSSELYKQDEKQVKSLLSAYGIDFDQLLEGEKESVDNFVKNQNAIESQLSNAAESLSIDFSDKFNKAFENLHIDTDAFNAAIEPIFKNLATRVSNDSTFKDIAPELQSSVMAGLKEIAKQDISASEMIQQSNELVGVFRNLASQSGEYGEAIKLVEAEQEKFGDSLDEKAYAKGIQPAIDKLYELRDAAAEMHSVTGDAVAEFYDNQIAQIENFASSGMASLNEAFNTMSGQFAEARGAYDEFSEAVKDNDFYTAADNMKKIFDEIDNDIDKAGLGSKKFWMGAEELLGAENIDGLDKEAVAKQLDNIKPLLQEGEDGFQAFWDLIDQHKDKLNELDGVTVGEDGWLEKWPDDLSEISKELGISEKLLASLLDKSRQFAHIDLSDPTKVREAIATSGTAITGLQGDKKNLYVKESSLRASLREADYTTTDSQNTEIKRMEDEEQIITIGNPEDLSEEQVSAMKQDLGLGDLPGLIETFGQTGEYNKEEMQALAERFDLFEDQKSFDEAYNDWVDKSLDPTQYKQTDLLGQLNNNVASIAASVVSKRIQEGHLDKPTAEQSEYTTYGQKGVADTLAQLFSKGKDGNGNYFQSDASFERNKKAIEEQRDSYQEYLNVLKEGRENATGAEKEKFDKEIASYEKMVGYLDQWIKDGEAAYKKHKEEENQENIEQPEPKDNNITKDADKKEPDTDYDEERLKNQKEFWDNIDSKVFGFFEKLFTTDFGEQGKNQKNETGEGIDLTDTTTEEPKEAARQAAQEKFRAWIQGLIEGSQNISEDPKTIATQKARDDYKSYIDGIREGAINQKNTGGIDAEAQAKTQEKIASMWQAIKAAFTSNNIEDPKVEAGKKAAEIWKSIWSNVKKVFSDNSDVNTNSKTNNGRSTSSEITETNGELAVTYTGKIANSEELKASLEQQITSLLNTIASQQSKMSATATVNVKQGTIEKPKAQKAVVNYTKGKQAKADAQTANVDYKLGKQEAPKAKSAAVNYTLGSQANPSPKTMDISPHFTGTWEKNVKITFSTARGMNNTIPYRSTPTFGSAAKGRYGKVGPKGKGGLTLTGEEGFEIAWLPSENRSMILGMTGPQMINLPSDAVVYTHEQSQDILKRKSIPAGSHRGTSSSPVVRRQSTGGSSSSSSSSSSSTNKVVKTAAKAVTQAATTVSSQAGFISTYWENAAHRVDALQKKIDKSLDNIDKKFKTFGTTLNSMKGTIASYKTNLETSIAINENRRKRAQDELGILAFGRASKTFKDVNVRYDKKEISYETKNSKGKTTTKKEVVSLAPYIKYNKDYNTYELDNAALKQVAKTNVSMAKALKEAAESALSDRKSKLKTAEDAIKKAQEALEKVSNDVYQTFYAWEKSINRVYLLSQKLEILNAKLTTSNAKLDLQFNKMEAGTTKASAGLSKVTAALKNQSNLLQTKANASYQNLSAKQTDYQKSLTLTPYLNNYVNNKDSTDAKNQYLAAFKALKFLDQANLGGNKFDYNKAISYLNSQQMTKNEYEAIKSVLDGIFEKQNAFLDAQSEAYQSIDEIYQTMEEYQSFIVDFENNLLSGIEEQAEDQIQRLDKLNSSLTKAYKDLLDEVKRKLDERRKQEDNAKTETDISKKQQRLAALQADTAGGHAVEIAQLQKEIAEAQQNYQRSLEDQLIEKLQNQGDEAERQRQRQIELLEAQKEIADQTGTNLEQVKQWLQNPQANYEAIRSAWLTNQGYEDATPNGRKQLEEQFEVEFAKYQGYSAQLKQYQQMVGSLTSLETNVDKLVNSVATIAYNSAQLHAQKVPAKTLFNAGWSADVLAKGGYSTKDIVEAGYKESQLRAAGITPTTVKNYNKQNPKNPISLASFKKAGFDSSEASEAGYTPTAIKKVYGTTKTSTTKKSTTITSTKITAAQKASAQKAYKAFLTSHGSKKGKYKGQLTAQQLKTQLSNGKIGYNYAEMPMLQALANTDALTWVHVLKAYKNLKGKKTAAENVKKYFGSNPSPARSKGWKAAFGKTYPKYATGGLADSTGPAWLDGTPSKPELVLNAKDTQNFIALKDVLAKAMNSMGDTSNTYGDITYEININVDKIEKDYDVDRVVEKVKKEITKGAGYRNVTQVRNFR